MGFYLGSINFWLLGIIGIIFNSFIWYVVFDPFPFRYKGTSSISRTKTLLLNKFCRYFKNINTRTIFNPFLAKCLSNHMSGMIMTKERYNFMLLIILILSLDNLLMYFVFTEYEEASNIVMFFKNRPESYNLLLARWAFKN